ncbi:MAG: hypothetical protein H0X38_03340 [Planctomycetes bacterium]|nr:hypothetical protein [Planctomycetota bacterium]
MSDRVKRLSNSDREDLGDLRIKLETAAHNIQVMLKNQDIDEIRVAVGNATEMTAQALAALQRVRDHLG